MSNRSSASKKARRGSRRPPRNVPVGFIFLPCFDPGCRLCRLLEGSIHPWRDGSDQSCHTEKSERPRLAAGPLQINTPAATGADQRVQRNG